MTPSEIAWLAGLLEGEGCFLLTDKIRRPNKPGICIALRMVDRDVIEKAARLMENAKVRGPYLFKHSESSGLKNSRKPIFETRKNGAAAVRIMEAILPHMGERRSATILAIVEEWKKHPRHEEQHIAARCHPDLPNKAGGLCALCYGKELRRRKAAGETPRRATCHPERGHYSKGLCMQCYESERARRRYGNGAAGTAGAAGPVLGILGQAIP